MKISYDCCHNHNYCKTPIDSQDALCVSQLLFISFGCVQADTSYFYFSSSACHNVSVLELKQIIIQSHVIYYSIFKKKKKKKKPQRILQQNPCPEDIILKCFLRVLIQKEGLRWPRRVSFTEYLLCSKSFMDVRSFNPHNNQMRIVL